MVATWRSSEGDGDAERARIGRRLAGEHPVYRSGRQGGGEEVSLTQPTAQTDQRGALLGDFDAFGDRLQLERVAQPDDRPCQGRAVGAKPDLLDERARDLEDVDREPLEITERRVPRTEVVDGEPDPDCLEL